MCVLALAAASYADVSHGSLGFQTELLRPVGKAFSAQYVSPAVSPAFNLWTGNNTQTTTKQEKTPGVKVCPSRQNVKARGSMRLDLRLKKTAPAENINQEKHNFWEKCAGGVCKEDHSDSSWDEFTPDGKDDELKSQCDVHKDHNMRVGCMVNAVLNTQKEAMQIVETDGKIKVVGTKSGEVHFESAFTTSWEAWQDQESKESEEDLERWDNFKSSLINDDDDKEKSSLINDDDDQELVDPHPSVHPSVGEPGMSEVVHSDDFDESY